MERKYIMQLPRGAKVSSTDIKYEDGKIVLTAQLEEWEPEDGDICYLKANNTHVFVFKSFRYNKTGASCYISLSGNYLIYNAFITNLGDIRPATEEERKKLFDAMAKEGKRWDPEKKIVENVRWRAKPGEYYYYISGLPDKTPEVSFRQETCSAQDNMDYNRGNYFRTTETAVIAGNQMLELLKKSKAE